MPKTGPEIALALLDHFDPALALPSYETAGAAGMDLRASLQPDDRASGLMLPSRGRVLLCARLASCWRSATFSSASSVRVDDSARSRRKRTVKTAIVALMTPGS